MSAAYINVVRKVIYGTSALVSKVIPIPVNGFIFCYHSIGSDNWDFSVPEVIFHKHIDYLMSHFDPFSLDDLKDYINGVKTTNRPFFMITFDDGYQNILSVKNYLIDKGIKPVSFVLSHPENADRAQMLNNLPLLTIEQVKELKQAGWDIGCHSQTHTDFWKVTSENVDREVLGSKIKLEQELGFPVEYFAYPKGRYSVQIKEAIEKAGYKMAFSMDNLIFTRDSEILAIPRIGVMRTHSFSEFKSLPLGLSTKVRALLYKKTEMLNEN